MKIARKYTVPDKCPPDCPFIEVYRQYEMKAPCLYCPVFCCRIIRYGGETIYLVSPRQYPEMQAREWEKWFDGGMIGPPPFRAID